MDVPKRAMPARASCRRILRRIGSEMVELTSNCPKNKTSRARVRVRVRVEDRVRVELWDEEL